MNSRMHILKRVPRFRLPLVVFAAAVLLASLCACGGPKEDPATVKRVVMSLGKPINTLDPAMANDTTSQYVCGAFYDTLLQYHYAEGDYTLEPCMLTAMPEVSADGASYTCVLRDDLFFQDGGAFAGADKSARKITARDVAFSILRLADTRLHSPGIWLIRDRIRGLDAFRKRTEAAKDGDYSPYDDLCEGLEVKDDRTLVIHLEQPDPRFLYALALPYTAVVSRRALEHYGDDFADHPQGSGPFRLARWEKDYIIEMERNPEYHPEIDGRVLPASDRISCYLVKQDVASWLSTCTRRTANALRQSPTKTSSCLPRCAVAASACSDAPSSRQTTSDSTSPTRSSAAISTSDAPSHWPSTATSASNTPGSVSPPHTGPSRRASPEPSRSRIPSSDAATSRRRSASWSWPDTRTASTRRPGVRS